MLIVNFLLCNLNVSFLILAKLFVDGDIESNPGPIYNIVKLVKASFHQGNPMFSESAGTQCACNALFSICWAKIISTGYWKSCDLDYILIKGDEFSKVFGSKGFA